jgi:hypothetical protein
MKHINKTNVKKLMELYGNISVADPGCLSWIPDPDFCPSWIRDFGFRTPDPVSKNSNKKEGWKKFVRPTFFVATQISQN